MGGDYTALTLRLTHENREAQSTGVEGLPWVDQHRAAVGGANPPVYVHDGQISAL